MELKHIINQNEKNETINSILTNQLQISNKLLNKLIKNKSIFLNGLICDTRNKALHGDVLIIDLNNKEDNSNIISTKMDLNIIFEDEWMLVVDKPAGIPIHPSTSHYTDSLSNGIKFYFDSINLSKKVRPINRLDLNTSGIVIFAKCEYIQEMFIKQMNIKTFKKEYICLVNGFLKQKKDTISLPIARKLGSIIERCIDKQNGQPSITHYEVINEFSVNNLKYSLVKCFLETGRTHQIRVHMKAIGHPLLGDTLYDTNSTLINRQALHSYKIECIHPITKKSLIFVSELPEDIKKLIN